MGTSLGTGGSDPHQQRRALEPVISVMVTAGCLTATAERSEGVRFSSVSAHELSFPPDTWAFITQERHARTKCLAGAISENPKESKRVTPFVEDVWEG